MGAKSRCKLRRLRAPATNSPLKTNECTALRDMSEGRSLLCMPSVWFEADAFEQLSSYVNSSKGAYAPNTERARLSDSRIFAEWCQDERRKMLSSRPETIAAFIDTMTETRAPATVRRYATSISHLHHAAGLTNPCNDELVRLALRRMHRAKGRRGNQKLA